MLDLNEQPVSVSVSEWVADVCKQLQNNTEPLTPPPEQECKENENYHCVAQDCVVYTDCSCGVLASTNPNHITNLSRHSAIPIYPSLHSLKRCARAMSNVSNNDSSFLDTPAETTPDHDATPRASKRMRTFSQFYNDTVPYLSSPSNSSKSGSEASLESHKSGRLSPVKQMHLLEELASPVSFLNFDDRSSGVEEPEDVTNMRDALELLGDGVRILGRSVEENQAIVEECPGLSKSDRRRLTQETCCDATEEGRRKYGETPAIREVKKIVDKALELDQGTGASEDDWNTQIHHRLIQLALETSVHWRTLALHSVKTSRIEPKILCSTSQLPGRIIDYAVSLKPDTQMMDVFPTAPPPPTTDNKKTCSSSWNHISTPQHIRRQPIALNIETKSPIKSWTDGKPQIGIWVDAWLRRIEHIQSLNPSFPISVSDKRERKQWPAIPVLIAQGHDWHLLIGKRILGQDGNGQRLLFWDDIPIGTTRNVFGAYKLVAILHWLLDWSETIWRPWIHSLIR